MTAAAFPPFVTPAGTGLRQHAQAADPQGRRPEHSQDPAGGCSATAWGLRSQKAGSGERCRLLSQAQQEPTSCATPSSVSSPQT